MDGTYCSWLLRYICGLKTTRSLRADEECLLFFIYAYFLLADEARVFHDDVSDTCPKVRLIVDFRGSNERSLKSRGEENNKEVLRHDDLANSLARSRTGFDCAGLQITYLLLYLKVFSSYVNVMESKYSHYSTTNHGARMCIENAQSKMGRRKIY